MKLFVNTLNILNFDLVLNNQHWKLLNSLTIGEVFISHPNYLYGVGQLFCPEMINILIVKL